MWDANEVVTIFDSALPGVSIGKAIIERQIGNVMLAPELLQHVIGADAPALVGWVQQFCFEPEDAHD
jgi:hypothetical protein